MDKIRRLRDRLFGKSKKDDEDIYKEKIYKAVKTRNIKKLTKNLQGLECIEPQEAVSFLKDILKQVVNNNQWHEDKIDMFEDLQDTIAIMLNNYDENYKSSKVEPEKLEKIKDNFEMIAPRIVENKQKVRKNGEIQDILTKALERFLQCRQPYPEVLPKIFKTIIKKDVQALREIIANINLEKEPKSYLIQQIKTSYTVENLKDEIKCLKSDNSKTKKASKQKSLLEVDIYLWDLLKGLEKNVEVERIETRGCSSIRLGK